MLRVCSFRSAAASLVLALTAPALAAVVDQHNEGPISGGTSVGVIGAAFGQSAAQTITVGISGFLDHVEMYVYAGGSLSSGLVLDIQTVSSDRPSGNVVALSQVLPGPAGLQWVSFDFSGLQFAVTQGQQLALVLHSNQDLSHGEYDAEGSHDLYGGGSSYYHLISGSWTPINDYDLLFRTWVTPGGSLCCNGDFNNDGDTGTDEDIEAFFACMGGNCCATCGTADFNCDEDYATDADIESFFRVIAGGPC